MVTKTNILTQQIQGGNVLTVDSVPVSGGTLYLSSVQNGGTQSDPSMAFVPLGAASPTRHLRLTDGYSDAGAGLTTTAGAGVVGVTRVAGTSLQLVGEATSSNAKTDKVMWEFNLPDTYVAGSAIPVTVNSVVTGAGTLTGASTTMTLAAYTEINGVETALTVSAAQQIAATTATDLAFTVTGTGLSPAQRVVFELTMLVTSANGANTGYINKVAYQA